MAKAKPAKAPKRRRLFDEMMAGVRAMREHREGRLTMRTHEVEPISLPPVDANFVRETREGLRMSRQVFAFKLGVNPRTLERWEQGRSNLTSSQSPSSAWFGSSPTLWSVSSR